MYQLTQLAADRHRQRLAAAEPQHPAQRALALAGPPAAPSGGCAAPPARPRGCAPSFTPRPPPISDHPPATASNPSPSHHQEVAMNRTHPFRPIRRLACTLAALAATLVATTAAAPAALAHPAPPVGGGDQTVPPPPVHSVIAGGMPGWQIALIAIGAAVVAAAVAVRLDRARAARRHQPAPSA